MVLQPQSLASHNQMLGKAIPHPPSTNFYDDDSTSPAVKRLKRDDSRDSDVESNAEGGNTPTRPFSAAGYISESENGGDQEDDVRTVRATDLESALPPIRTDKEAIEEYEAARAAEQAELGLEERLMQRKWIKGKNSIYVDAFNLALDTVLEDEGHLFDEPEMAVFQAWRDLDYEAQYLYVRLFLRKTAVWHRIEKLGYYGDIADLPVAVDALQISRPLPDSTAEVQSNPGELNPPEHTVLGPDFTFADGSEEEITTLDEASTLLNLDELKNLAKDAKVQGKNKGELLRALRRSSKAQKGLGFNKLRRTASEDSVDSDGRSESGDVPDSNYSSTGSKSNRDSHYVRKILSSTGPCIRLTLAPLKLFERVHLVFYRSTEWTEKSLTTIILARISRRNFPEFIVSRSTNIFLSRALLLEFEASIRTQFRVDNILEYNGTPGKKDLQEVLDTFEEVYPRWKALVKEEQRKEERVYESGEGAYLRRFSPAWVYTRIAHKGTFVLGRFKHHKREHELLCELLEQRLFHSARRGAWYQRKALLEEHYMADLMPSDGRSPEAQKRHWKRISMRTCEEGLQDKECHHTYHYDLQKRVRKLERSMKVVKREQHDFGHVSLAKPFERTVEGVRIQRGDPVGARRDSNSLTSGRGTKTVWIDEREDDIECSVEHMCLSWYRNQGWKGYHSEGGIVRTLFAYLFYDVLFVYIPNVFQTPYQTCPLDLHTDAFYPSRASEIHHRLADIANGESARLIKELWERESERKTCVIGLDWSFELEDLLEIIECFDGEALATICKVMAQEYRERGGGMPDLFLWDPDKKEVMFSEVKSENDRLSDTQRLWIHVLTGAGVKVELCNAIAREVRTT